MVRLSAKPMDMPAKITIDVTDMDINSSVTIETLPLPANVSAVFDQNYALVSIIDKSKVKATPLKAKLSSPFFLCFFGPVPHKEPAFFPYAIAFDASPLCPAFCRLSLAYRKGGAILDHWPREGAATVLFVPGTMLGPLQYRIFLRALYAQGFP